MQKKKNKALLQRSENTEELSIEEKQDLVLFFKSCLTSKCVDEIKDKLKSTVKFRAELLSDESTNIPELFHFFFVKPELVRFHKFFI